MKSLGTTLWITRHWRVLSLLLLASLIQCQQPLEPETNVIDEEVLPTTQGISITTIAPSEDSRLLSLLDLFRGDQGSRVATGDLAIEDINLTVAVRVENLTMGHTRYSLKLEDDHQGIDFQNLMLKEDQHGQIFAQIIHYKPDEDWFINQNGEMNMDVFTGDIEILNLDGELLMSSSITDGQSSEVLAYTALSNGRTTCDQGGSGGSGGGGGGDGGDGSGSGGGSSGSSSPVYGGGGRPCTIYFSSGCNERRINSNGRTALSASSCTSIAFDCSGLTASDQRITCVTDSITYPDCIDDDCVDPIGIVDDDGGEAVDVESVKAARWARNNVHLDSSFSENPCVMTVYNRLMGNNILYSVLGKFHDRQDLTLNWLIDDVPGETAAGETSDYDNGVVSITIEKTLVGESSELIIAAVMLHEALHAELTRAVAEHDNTIDAMNMDIVELLDKLAELNPPVLDSVGVNNPVTQHLLMAKDFRTIIMDGLYAYLGTTRDDPNAPHRTIEIIAWGGLLDIVRAVHDGNQYDLIGDEPHHWITYEDWFSFKYELAHSTSDPDRIIKIGQNGSECID